MVEHPLALRYRFAYTLRVFYNTGSSIIRTIIYFSVFKVVLMSDYELLMIVFTVMGILVAVLIEYIKK